MREGGKDNAVATVDVMGMVRGSVSDLSGGQEKRLKVREVLAAIPIDERSKTGLEILKGYLDWEDRDDDYDGFVLGLVVGAINLKSDQALEAGDWVLKKMRKGDFEEPGMELKKQELSMFGEVQAMMFRKMAAEGASIGEFNEITRYFTEVGQLPSRVNLLRKMVDDEELPQTERKYLENILRGWLGIEAGKPLHTSLESVYKAIDFREYKVNLASQEERLNQVERLWNKHGISKDSRVVDVACGTGWFVNEMTKRGYEQIFGIDISDKNIELAKADFGEGRFARANWDKQPFEDGELDGETCLGRSLPHCEDGANFDLALREMLRVVRKDGLIIFDMPNPKKGSYARNQEYFKGLLRQVGYGEGELKAFDFTVDAPDAVERGEGRNLYNRYTPTEEEINAEVEFWGGEVVEVVKTEIKNGTGEDENMVFVVKNTKEFRGSKLFKHGPSKKKPAPEGGGDGGVVDNDTE